MVESCGRAFVSSHRRAGLDTSLRGVHGHSTFRIAPAPLSMSFHAAAYVMPLSWRRGADQYQRRFGCPGRPAAGLWRSAGAARLVGSQPERLPPIRGQKLMKC